jgi:hypothetical protein
MLHEYVEVAAHLKLIENDTAKLVRLAKDFRNLIHPGLAIYDQQLRSRFRLDAGAALAAVLVPDNAPELRLLPPLARLVVRDRLGGRRHDAPGLPGEPG